MTLAPCRYILNLSIMDHSGHIWVTGFNDVGEQLLGVTANELIALKVSPSSIPQHRLIRKVGSLITRACVSDLCRTRMNRLSRRRS
jgi:hypothetical protein